MNVTVDTSELAALTALLTKAATRSPTETAAALAVIADQVEAEARSNAASFTTASTGELAGSITVTGSKLTQTIDAPVRQAFFLEAGSPNTGAPRPWLTGPLETGANALLAKVSELGDLW